MHVICAYPPNPLFILFRCCLLLLLLNTLSSSSSSSSYLCVQECASIALMQTDDCYGCPQSRLIVNLKPAN